MTSLYRRTRALFRPLRRGFAHYSVQLRHGWIPAVRARLRPWRLRAASLVIKLRYPTGFDPARPIVFLHIPKTSGIAFATGLIDAVPPRDEFFGFDPASFGSFRDFSSVAPETRAMIHLTPDTVPRGREFVRAHVAYSTLEATYGHGQFITVLREPGARILSHWLFWRGFPEAETTPWGGWGARMRLSQGSLAEFLNNSDLACQVDNLSCRLLLWPNKLIPDDDFIDPANDAALLIQASDRLQRFRFVDIVENPELPANLSRWLRRDFHYGRANETPTMPISLRGDLQAEMAQVGTLLDQRSRLDRALWLDVAKERGVTRAVLDQAAGRAIARFGRLLAG